MQAIMTESGKNSFSALEKNIEIGYNKNDYSITVSNEKLLDIYDIKEKKH